MEICNNHIFGLIITFVVILTALIKSIIKEERTYNMPDIHDMTSDAYPSVSEVLEMIDQANCKHKDMEYQAYEPDTNVPEDYYCLDCGKQFDIPEPDEDELRGDR